MEYTDNSIIRSLICLIQLCPLDLLLVAFAIIGHYNALYHMEMRFNLPEAYRVIQVLKASDQHSLW